MTNEQIDELVWRIKMECVGGPVLIAIEVREAIDTLETALKSAIQDSARIDALEGECTDEVIEILDSKVNVKKFFLCCQKDQTLREAIDARMNGEGA